MEFRIADTFSDSMARLTGDEQKLVKTTAFDLQLNPVNPGMSFHKLDQAKDKNFWSVRVSSDIRIIVHRTEASLLLCYVDHHDKAYQWAARRKIETHPKTGAAQLVEIRETVHEVVVPVYVPVEQPRPPLFANITDDRLLGYGVPPEWLADVRAVTEDNLLTLVEHLPKEAAEALVELATGGTPAVAKPPAPSADPFAHPDAQRRFRIMGSAEELARALDAPWEKWMVFLHPAQRDWIERDYNGPARVSGSAGTGKTIVALHRAAYLARSNPEARVLLTTYSEVLANALRNKVLRLLGNEPRLGERLDVLSLPSLGERLYNAYLKSQLGALQLVSEGPIHELLAEASAALSAHKFSLRFLQGEWEQVIDPWQVDSWEAYRDVKRLGRKTRLSEAQRAVLWSIFERVRDQLGARHQLTHAALFTKVAQAIRGSKKLPYDYVVVDEAQDLGVAHLRLLSALGGDKPNGLFFAGDLGQRIFQQPISWKGLGVDVRGRARTLTVNYRTSHQIRMQADRLLGAELSDADGNSEKRAGTVSVFNGPAPVIEVLENSADEIGVVGRWLAKLKTQGLMPHELGVFVRSDGELARAKAAVAASGLTWTILDDHVSTQSGRVAIGTMHLAKGLEFRAVAVVACDDEVIPSQERIENVSEEADLEEVYNTERHLLYVACTRARDHLLITGVAPASEFVEDLRESARPTFRR